MPPETTADVLKDIQKELEGLDADIKLLKAVISISNESTVKRLLDASNGLANSNYHNEAEFLHDLANMLEQQLNFIIGYDWM